jgi:hypothetical protein
MILCSLILQLEDGSVVLYLKTIEEDGLEIITAGIQKPRTVDEFVQAWRNQIWDYGYMGWFKGKEAYTIGILTLLSSVSSAGLVAIVIPVEVHSLYGCVILRKFCLISLGIS